MDDQPRSPSNERAPADPAEGVRIIGADEAAEAIERGEVSPRRADDELRYGDRPPPPPASPRPALRFPLDASADPTRIERPPVEPAPDPVTGPVELPHWTEPPTGEVPAVLIGDDAPLLEENEDDLDAWSSFATSTPRWRDADDDWGDDGFVEALGGDEDVRVGALGGDEGPTHDEYYGFDDLEARVEERAADSGSTPAVWADDDDWNASQEGEAPPAAQTEAEWDDDEVDPDEPGDGYGDDRGSDGYHDEDIYEPAGPDEGSHGRNLGQAVPIGLALGAVAIAIGILPPAFGVLVVTVAIGLGAAEYFGVLRKVGWEAATLLGLVSCTAFPLAVYWRHSDAYGLVGFLVVAATLTWYLVGAGGSDPRVLEGSGSTLLGVGWVGGLGSAAALMLAVPDGRALLLTAIAATVAYDTAGFFVGRAMGHRPLSSASPNKTVEGLVGGMVSAFLVVLVVVAILKVGPWTGAGAMFVMGFGVAAAAPLGDLCQSVLKRDLGVKDMGTLLPGHGGVLDRLDGLLFVLPTVLWLSLTVGNIARF